MKYCIHWFNKDLRLADHPALWDAAEQNCQIIGVYILEKPPSQKDDRASNAWLHSSLQALQREIGKRNGRLLFFIGNPIEVFRKIAAQQKIEWIQWTKDYEPNSRSQKVTVKNRLTELGFQVKVYPGNVLTEPGHIRTQSGAPYRVFTPYWKAAQKVFSELPNPMAIHRRMKLANFPKLGISLPQLKLTQSKNWESKTLQEWQPGEKGAQKALSQLDNAFLSQYALKRDIPSIEGTSSISPHLAFGEITPNQIRHSVGCSPSSKSFIRQLAWREFAYQLLDAHPETLRHPLNKKFSKFDWNNNQEQLELWQTGNTGYPIVDAGMRQLLQTGWMHNRIRMITASFLVKDLLLHWTKGASWFEYTLFDSDPANNTMGWQWVTGCGADAAPFFRVFNPSLQARRFDPKGSYVKQWIAELKGVPAKFVHEPWKLTKHQLEKYGVRLGKNYPHRIIEHQEARQIALKRYYDLMGAPTQANG